MDAGSALSSNGRLLNITAQLGTSCDAGFAPADAAVGQGGMRQRLTTLACIETAP